MQSSSQVPQTVGHAIHGAANWIGRVLVIALLAYSPWLYGMVSWTQHVLLFYWALGISAATVLYLMSGNPRVPVGNLLITCLLGLLVLGIVQTTPLPQAVYESVSAARKFELAAVRQVSNGDSKMESKLLKAIESESPHELTLSIYPIQTRCSLAVLASAIAILLCCTILFHDKLGRAVLLISLCSTSTSVAVLGILQSVSWNSWTLLPMPTTNHFATFVSRNSAPQYLAVGIGCALALIGLWKRRKDKQREKNYQRRYPASTVIAKVRQVLEDLVLELDAVMVILLTVLVTHIVAVVATASRGGFVSLIFSAGVCLLFFLANNRRWIIAGVISFVSVALISSSALDLFDLDDEISERLQDLNSQGRYDLWASSIGQSQYWAAGSGMGTFRFAIMPDNPMGNIWPLHAESIYVETFVEFGVIGLFMILAGLSWLLIRLSPSSDAKSSRMWPAALYCVLAVAVQSFVDFSLIIPAVFLPLVALVGAYLNERFEFQIRSSPGTALATRVKMICILLALMLVGWYGYQPLLGFAQSEKLEQWYKDSSAKSQANENSVLDDDLILPEAKYDYSHPEVVLALTRIRLSALENLVTKLPDWPKTLSVAEQKQLSSAEFISAVHRSTLDDPVWKGRQEYFDRFPKMVSELRTCNSGFQFVSRACKLDWRTAWGRFQTLTEPNPEVDKVNWARLNLLCGSVFNTQEVLGTCCIIAGDRELGVEAWKSVVARNPNRASELSKLLGTLLSADDILQILPDHPIATAELSRSLYPQDATREVSMKLMESIDMQRLTKAASNVGDWELVAWVSESLGDSAGHEKSLESIANLRPFDALVRFRLAQLLEKQGRTAEAIKQLEQASRRTTLPTHMQNYLNELRLNRATTSSGG